MATATARSTANLLLYLSLSTVSKKIAKQGGGKLHHRGRVDGAFRCRTCGREFATFQALGGHRTSHKRPRVRAAGLDLLLGARPGKGAATDVHRCNTCGMVFPTGQALGGHMRRHRAPAAGLEVAVTPTASSLSGLSEEGDHENDHSSGHSLTLFKFI